MRHLLLSILLLLAATPVVYSQTDPVNEPTDAAADQAAASFGWGAEIASGIDIGGHDMSNISIKAFLGVKTKIFQMIGVGTGIDMMMSNSCRAFPIYALMRTSFGYRNPTCFADFRIGCAINRVDDHFKRTNVYVAPGVGINFAQGASYRSYMIFSFVYNDLQYPGYNPDYGRIRGLTFANVSIGITF